MKIEERTCDICKQNFVENETHFICECSAYENIRTKLFNDIAIKDVNFNNLSTEEKYIYLMKNEAKLLSLYIIDIWNVRTIFLYK